MKRIRQKTRKNKGFLGRLINRIRGGKNDNQKFVEPAKYGGVLDTAEVIAKSKPTQSIINPLGSGISRIIKKRIANNINPFSYDRPLQRIVNAFNPFHKPETGDEDFDVYSLQNHERQIRQAAEIDDAGGREAFMERHKYGPKEGNIIVNAAEKHRERQQLFNAMMGLSMNSYKGVEMGGYDGAGGLKPSQYRPTNAEDPDANYLSSPLEERTLIDSLGEGGYENIKQVPTNETLERKKKRYMADGYSEEEAAGMADLYRRYGSTAGNMTLTLGEDENGTYISYYDIWDLDPFQNNEAWGKISDGAQNLLGIHPQELYGRVYYTSDEDGNFTSIYDPKTGETLKTFN